MCLLCLTPFKQQRTANFLICQIPTHQPALPYPPTYVQTVAASFLNCFSCCITEQHNRLQYVSLQPHTIGYETPRESGQFSTLFIKLSELHSYLLSRARLVFISCFGSLQGLSERVSNCPMCHVENLCSSTNIINHFNNDKYYKWQSLRPVLHDHDGKMIKQAPLA